jgi:nicotinate-nucleotide pyrophosphorylase (carboxylating)
MDGSMVPPLPIDDAIRALIRLAVQEDLGLQADGSLLGDRTVQAAIPATMQGTGTIVARADGVISGTFLLPEILAQYPGKARCEILTNDGAVVRPQTAIARCTGDAGTILSAERVLLNFLGILSGTASLTRRYVDAVAGLPKRVQICDTRKTIPGFRRLQKHAVMCGGGVNHRLGLFDGIMLKDNHLAALRETLGAGLTLAQLTQRVKQKAPNGVAVWLEVDTLAQLREALPEGGADIILLDNMSHDDMREAVRLRDAIHPARPALEASGGVNLQTVRAIAETGVDRISIGAMTHSAGVLDLSMEGT